MNEAAIPADAFSVDYALTGDDIRDSGLDILKHAVGLGYSPTTNERAALVKIGFTDFPAEADTVWAAQWNAARGGRGFC